MSKRGPKNRQAVRKDSDERLKQMRECGIEFVAYLDAGTAHVCPACRAFKRAPIPIGNALPLPLPECDQEYCGCVITAELDPLK